MIDSLVEGGGGYGGGFDCEVIIVGKVQGFD